MQPAVTQANPSPTLSPQVTEVVFALAAVEHVLNPNRLPCDHPCRRDVFSVNMPGGCLMPGGALAGLYLMPAIPHEAVTIAARVVAWYDAVLRHYRLVGLVTPPGGPLSDCGWAWPNVPPVERAVVDGLERDTRTLLDLLSPPRGSPLLSALRLPPSAGIGGPIEGLPSDSPTPPVARGDWRDVLAQLPPGDYMRYRLLLLGEMAGRAAASLRRCFPVRCEPWPFANPDFGAIPGPGDCQKAQDDRSIKARMALAELLTSGPNATRIAERIGVNRTTLLGWPEFREQYDKAKLNREVAKRARRRGRRAGNGDFEVVED